MTFNYISIPKTGSRTVHTILNYDIKNNNHKPINQLKKKTFSFAFIREPVDRIQSWYYWCKYNYKKKGDPLRVLDFLQDDINTWIQKGCKHHWAGKIMKGLTHPLYQWDYININNEIAVTALGDFNLLTEQLPVIAKKHLEMPNIKTNVWLGKSMRKEILITPKSISKIEELFPKDFELYNRIKGDILYN
tara:strand:- start:295 stop:864 length:570 start_codon:yes stop_codon:yes gene_type:complete